MTITGADRRSIARIETVGAVFVIIVGTLWHFTYDFSGGSRVVGVFAPVNESVWEHLKLVLVPVLVFAVIETAWVRDRDRLWWSKFLEVVVAMGFIVAFFYTYTGALGVDSVVVVDIGSFFVAVIGGQWISYRLQVSTRAAALPWAASLALLGCLVVLFGVWTFVPPHLPLFQETSSGIYGPA